MRTLSQCLPLSILLITASASATPMPPEAFRRAFLEAKKTARVVAEVKVVSVVCSEVTIENPRVGSVVLQVAVQVLEVEKGPVKKNEIVVVSRTVKLPCPPMYGYMGDLHQFPFTPEVKGSIALNWDKEGRRYVAVSGWVKEPNHADIPRKVGQVISVAVPDTFFSTRSS